MDVLEFNIRFVCPIGDARMQAIVVLALEGATVRLYYGLAEADVLFLQEGEMYVFANINRNGANIRVASTGRSRQIASMCFRWTSVFRTTQ